MKKIVYGIASLTLAASLLGACSNKEEATNNTNTKQEAKAETTQSTPLSSGVQFVYNGKQVTDKDLKNYQDKYLVGVPPQELKSLGNQFVAKNYIVTHELLKYVSSSEDELKKEYNTYKEGVTDKATQMNLTEYVVSFLSNKLAEKELNTEKKQKDLYNQLDSETKDSMTFEEFTYDKRQMFYSAAKRNVIDVKKLQDDALAKANVDSKNLKVDNKLTKDEYMPFQ